jgi:hypothetical protein
MDGAHLVGELEVALQRLQQAAKSLRSAVREREDQGELRDPTLTSAGSAGALRAGGRRQLTSERGEVLLQRHPAQLRRVGEQLPQLLDLLLDGLVLLGPGTRLCWRGHDWFPSVR